MPRYMAFDLETVDPFPEYRNWREVRPLGIGCAAAYASDLRAPIFWCERNEQGGVEERMSRASLQGLVRTLAQLTAPDPRAPQLEPYTLLTWNGLGFDFDILAEELDFGRLGLVQDPETGRRRTAWALIVVLGYSRHSFVWPIFSQKLEDVIAGLEAAWAFFGGIPRYLVIDNFPAAVAGADALHPRLTRGFLEYSQHRGFIADPARVRHPKDKPKVERGVQYVRERFFKGGDFDGLAHLRAEAARWCRDVAGMRVHDTTRRQPLMVFQDEERQALAPWDGEPYEVTHWRTVKVHPDHHVACQYALYSVPSSLCPPGQRVEIGLGSKLAPIHHRGRLLKLHPPASLAAAAPPMPPTIQPS